MALTLSAAVLFGAAGPQNRGSTAGAAGPQDKIENSFVVVRTSPQTQTDEGEVHLSPDVEACSCGCVDDACHCTKTSNPNRRRIQSKMKKCCKCPRQYIFGAAGPQPCLSNVGTAPAVGVPEIVGQTKSKVPVELWRIRAGDGRPIFATGRVSAAEHDVRKTGAQQRLPRPWQRLPSRARFCSLMREHKRAIPFYHLVPNWHWSSTIFVM